MSNYNVLVTRCEDNPEIVNISIELNPLLKDTPETRRYVRDLKENIFYRMGQFKEDNPDIEYTPEKIQELISGFII